MLSPAQRAKAPLSGRQEQAAAAQGTAPDRSSAVPRQPTTRNILSRFLRGTGPLVPVTMVVGPVVLNWRPCSINSHCLRPPILKPAFLLTASLETAGKGGVFGCLVVRGGPSGKGTQGTHERLGWLVAAVAATGSLGGLAGQGSLPGAPLRARCGGRTMPVGQFRLGHIRTRDRPW